MGKRVTRVVDHVLDGLHEELVALKIRHPNTDSAQDFYCFLLLTSFFLSFFPLVCYFTVSRNPHIEFWLGMEPRLICLIVPGLLALLVLSMPLIKSQNFSQRSVHVLVFLLFVSAGASMITSAVHLETVALGVSETLVYRCGSAGGASHEVEQNWQQVNAFRRRCVDEVGSQNVDVKRCPGFSQLLDSEHKAYVAYLQELESDFECAGFCRFWASPLFAVGHVRAGRRCASAVGQEVARTGHLIAGPVIFSGLAVIAVGGLLAAYDHL
mmetsp:Transcript_42052/g.121501  ORF Transcript_42052/g.121501 Transcript_42052/m.121501 type:complete len:268 (+) Transcript_42052:113-916(+)